MTNQDLIALVQMYFAAVDAEDMDGVLATLTPDCRFTVETHGVVLDGTGEIGGMFERLWANHAAVLHDRFTYLPHAPTAGIATRFRVVNTHHDGSRTFKSNCNFFTVRDWQFDTVAVYMAGENTLERAAARAG